MRFIYWTVSLFIFSSAWPVPLCKNLLTLIAQHGAAKGKRAQTESQLVDRIIEALLEGAKTIPLLGSTRQATTAGLYKTEKAKAIRLHMLPYEDVSLLIVTSHGKESPWQVLSMKQRKLLVERLMRTFENGKYDYELADKIKPGDSPDRNFSPRQVLLAASEGKFSGVCADGSCALAGTLLELGIPPDQLRLVVGAASPTAPESHIWPEIQYQRSGAWAELDGTAAEGNELGPIQNRKDYPLIEAILTPPKNGGFVHRWDRVEPPK